MTTATEPIHSMNTQQFDDDEIVDNFDAGPDDGVPLGLGGEKGRQASPASTTLEADMVAQPTKPTKQEEKPLPGDVLPPDDAAAGGEPKPVQDTAGDDGRQIAEPKTVEPEPVDFPEPLLRMAGFSTAEDATKSGFKDPESLLAAVQLMGRAFAQPARPPEAMPPQAPPMNIPAEKPPQDGVEAFKPFKPTNPEIFDDELLKLIDAQNAHYAAQFEAQQKELARVATQLKARDEEVQQQEAMQQAAQFDRAVQGLGKDWEAEFGQGDGSVIFGRSDAASRAAARSRVDLFDAVNVLRHANAVQGGKPMTLEQEIQWALMQRYPEKFQQQLRRESEAKAQARRGVQASRPTARKTPLGTRSERLLSALQTRYPSVDFSEADDESDGDI